MLSEQVFGIYKAIVTDVSCFEQTGKIRTRISAFQGGGVPKDLLDGYDSKSYADVTSRDILTDIMLPFGGGYDYGMFKLPQVNSVGLVAFIDGSRTTPVWIGSTANSIFNTDNKLVQLDIPSDRNNGYPAKYFDKSENESVFNFDDANAFIIKTKKNELKDFNKPETMDWKKNPVENSFVLSSVKAGIYHRIDDDTYQELALINGKDENGNDTGSVEMSYVISEDEHRKITADDKSIIIRNKDADTEAKIVLIKPTTDPNGEEIPGGIYINSFEDNARNNELEGSRIGTSIKITPASIDINAGHSHITLSRNIDQSNEKVTISTSKLQIIADDISFGSSGYSFVVSPNSGLNFTLEDGSMLTTTNHIRV